jgi:hypothetical protein
MASGTLAIYGENAAAKARQCGEVLLERVKRAGFALERTNIECIGAGAVAPLPPLAPLGKGAEGERYNEVMLRVTAHDSRRPAVERFTKEFAPLVTSGPNGVTGYTTGRPAVRQVFAYWPALIEKTVVKPQVTMVG